MMPRKPLGIEEGHRSGRGDGHALRHLEQPLRGVAGVDIDRDRARIGCVDRGGDRLAERRRSEEHTSELQSLMRISYAVFCLKKKNNTNHKTIVIQKNMTYLTHINIDRDKNT